MTCTGISQKTLEPKPTTSSISPFPPTRCSPACNITSLTVLDSNLSDLDHHFIHQLDICPSSLVTIKVGGWIGISTLCHPSNYVPL